MFFEREQVRTDSVGPRDPQGGGGSLCCIVSSHGVPHSVFNTVIAATDNMGFVVSRSCADLFGRSCSHAMETFFVREQVQTGCIEWRVEQGLTLLHGACGCWEGGGRR